MPSLNNNHNSSNNTLNSTIVVNTQDILQPSATPVIASTRYHWLDKLECIARLIGEYLDVQDGIKMCMPSMDRHPFTDRLKQGIFGENAAAIAPWVQNMKPHHSFREVVRQIKLGQAISSDANYFHLFHKMNVPLLHSASKEINRLSQDLFNIPENTPIQELVKVALISLAIRNPIMNGGSIFSAERTESVISAIKSVKNIEFEFLGPNRANLVFNFQSKNNSDLKGSIALEEKDLILFNKMLMTFFDAYQTGSIKFSNVLNVLYACIDSPIVHQLREFLEKNDISLNLNPAFWIIYTCCNQLDDNLESLIEQLQVLKNHNNHTISLDHRTMRVTLTPEDYAAIYSSSKIMQYCLNRECISFHDLAKQHMTAQTEYNSISSEELRQEKSINALIEVIGQLALNNRLFSKICRNLHLTKLFEKVELAERTTALSMR